MITMEGIRRFNAPTTVTMRPTVTTTKGEPPMPEKKEQKKPRGTAINLPKELSDEITALSDEMGIQKSKIRGWVAAYVVLNIEAIGIRQIVAEQLRPLFKDATTDSE